MTYVFLQIHYITNLEEIFYIRQQKSAVFIRIWTFCKRLNINSKAKEKEKARVIALEQVTTKRPNQTVIYRWGNGNATNLTPRPTDLHTGLSYELKVPAATEYTITTMEAINATGVLTAVIDKPNHVSVRPVNPLEMMEWINSRPTAKENPYYLTKILASISIRDNGGPCNVSSD